MKHNIGLADQAARIFVVLVIAGLYFENLISGTTAIILLLLAGLLILTSIFSFCPLYLPFGLSTRKNEQ